jgi:hypothetical protein
MGGTVAPTAPIEASSLDPPPHVRTLHMLYVCRACFVSIPPSLAHYALPTLHGVADAASKLVLGVLTTPGPPQLTILGHLERKDK